MNNRNFSHLENEFRKPLLVLVNKTWVLNFHLNALSDFSSFLSELDSFDFVHFHVLIFHTFSRQYISTTNYFMMARKRKFRLHFTVTHIPAIHYKTLRHTIQKKCFSSGKENENVKFDDVSLVTHI